MLVAGQRVDFSDSSKFVTIIGTTKPTTREARASYDLAKFLAEKGYIIVSGLAEGIDTYAHLGALDSEGPGLKTVAIVSTALGEALYPKGATPVAKRIINNGCIIFPYGMIKAPWTDEKFGPKQKRLVERDVLQAALSEDIVAVSSDKLISGGTRWALNYGKHLDRKLYRRDPDMPGLIENPGYKIEPNLIWWNMEMDWRSVVEELQSNDYSLVPTF